jgi:hypothetical protein
MVAESSFEMSRQATVSVTVVGVETFMTIIERREGRLQRCVIVFKINSG